VFSFPNPIEDGSMTAQLTPVASDREMFEVRNPVTGESVGSYPVHTAEDIAARVEAARTAQTRWQELGFDGRRKRLHRWVRALARDCDTLYEVGFRETGKPKADVQFELLAGLEDIRWAASHAKGVLAQKRVAPGLAMLNFDARVSYEPLGVIGIITPWNAPVYTAFCGLAYELAAGNAVILKPSELAAATGVYAVESFYRANPDAPEGLVSWITAEGNTGWSYADVLPSFKRFESFEDGGNDFRGGSGPIKVIRARELTAASESFMEALSQTAGVKKKHDYNAAEQEGVSLFQQSNADGLRYSASVGYLDDRPGNLLVLPRTHVSRVVIENGRSTGVEILAKPGGRSSKRRGRWC
jgi:hypothetical protein